MRILMLSDINSAHTQKWAISLAERGLEVGVFSISSPRLDWYTDNGIRAFIPVSVKESVFSSGPVRKLLFLRLIPFLRRVQKSFRPDIVHAHYATSYGFIGAMAGFHPFVISAWGSDVKALWPLKIVGRPLLKFNFRKADALLATSQAMVPMMRAFSEKEVIVTPFGVDTEVFRKFDAGRMFHPDDLVIGTIKALEPTYGIPYLIRAFHIVKQRNPKLRLKLLIVGAGSMEAELKSLTGELGLEESVFFNGSAPYKDVPDYYNRMDIFVALSLWESFGVAVLEASACCLPVVVSDAGGLPEVVDPLKTGFIVPAADAEKAADAIEMLVLDKGMRHKMGEKGRAFIVEKYSIRDSVDRMLTVYRRLCPGVK
jgi:L-malate glycosyltransferase